MSLLHNAKKHFILAMVFVLGSAICSIIYSSGATYADVNGYLFPSERTMMAKQIIGTIFACSDTDHDNDAFGDGSFTSGWDIDGLGGYFINMFVKDKDLQLSIKNGTNIKHECSYGNLTKSAFYALDELYGKTSGSTWKYIEESYDGGIAGFSYDYLIHVDYETSDHNNRRDEPGVRELGVAYLKDHSYSDNVDSLDNATDDQRKKLLEFLDKMYGTASDLNYADAAHRFLILPTSMSDSDEEIYWRKFHSISWASQNGIKEEDINTESNSAFLCFKKDANSYSVKDIKCGYNSLTGWNVYYYEIYQNGDWSHESEDAGDIISMGIGHGKLYDAAIREAREYLAELKADKEKAEAEAKKSNSNASKEGCRNEYITWYTQTDAALEKEGVDKNDPGLKWSTIPTPEFLKGVKDEDYTYMPTSYIDQSGQTKITYWTGNVLWGTPGNDGKPQKTTNSVTPYVKVLKSPDVIEKYKDSKASEGAEPCYLNALVDEFFAPQIETFVKRKRAERTATDTTNNFKNGCAGLYRAWLANVFEINGANEMEFVGDQDSHGVEYTAKAKETREIINNTLQKVFGIAPTTWNDHSNWLEYVFVNPGSQKAIMRDWDNDNKNRSPDLASGGTSGACLSCDYIRMSQEALEKYAPQIQFNVVTEGCRNPTADDFSPNNTDDWSLPDFGDWTNGIVYTDPTFKDPTITANDPYENSVYEPDTCYEGSGSLGWILCPLIAGASNIGKGLWEQIETYHLKLPANALFGSIGSSNESGIHRAWRSIRDISNIVFIIVFLVIVISQVTGVGITNYGIKKMLPKLIVCIIIVNLSYILCQIAVDLSNTIGSSVIDFLRGITETIPWSIAEKVDADSGLLNSGFITGALIAGGAGGLFALITSMRTGQNGAGAIIGGLGLFVLGIVIIILVAIITLYVTLMIREAAVVVCIAIAPLAIVCNVLPNTQPLFKKWLSLIKALLVLYPVSAFMVGGGQLAGAILASTGLNTMRLAAGVVQVLPYFFVPTLLRKSLAGLGNIGAKIGSLGKTYGRKASHGATGLIKNSRRYQDMLASSKTNAANRYKTSEQARLERKKERKERHGGQLSEPDVFRLQAAQEYNESRDAKIDAARRSIEADRAAARRRANSTEIAIKDDKLMETYGGAQRDINTGEMITNPDGSYVIDANRANAYAEGVRLSSQVSTRKEAEEKVAQAAHRQSLYLASARKSDIDLDNNLRTARAYSEDMDENGNFVPAGTGTYHASDYVNNQRRTQENKTNSALASGYVRPMETTFAGAHNQAQIRASEEIGKAAESEFREMDKAGPNGLATRMNTMARNIGARDANGNRTFASPGQLETLESSIKVASSRGLEKEAYASYNAALNSFGQAFAEAQASGNTTEMQEIQSRMDSFKRSMQSSPIKAISIHAKQTENMQIDSDMAASDANSYYQGAEFAGYADKKGGNLTIDKDSSAIFQRIGANFSAVHAMEQLGKNDLTQTQITDFAAMAERDLASNNTDISRALSARTLVNLPASTITTIASGTSDVNRNALMAAMNNISAQAMEKLTQEQVRALQILNPNFGNNTSGNAGSNTGSNAGGNAGNNAGSDWGGSSDNDSGPFAI